jgi:hypothetical protein
MAHGRTTLGTSTDFNSDMIITDYEEVSQACTLILKQTVVK